MYEVTLKSPWLADHPGVDLSKAWVLLWCKTSGMIHLETVGDMVKAHMRAFRDDKPLRFIPLLVGDRALIDEAVAAMQPTLAARYNAKNAHELGFIPYEALP